MTRVLIERLIVNKPHPWGLLNTFYELIRNPVSSNRASWARILLSVVRAVNTRSMPRRRFTAG